VAPRPFDTSRHHVATGSNFVSGAARRKIAQLAQPTLSERCVPRARLMPSLREHGRILLQTKARTTRWFSNPTRSGSPFPKIRSPAKGSAGLKRLFLTCLTLNLRTPNGLPGKRKCSLRPFFSEAPYFAPRCGFAESCEYSVLQEPIQANLESHSLPRTIRLRSRNPNVAADKTESGSRGRRLEPPISVIIGAFRVRYESASRAKRK
jgi:hypothetical protein